MAIHIHQFSPVKATVIYSGSGDRKGVRRASSFVKISDTSVKTPRFASGLCGVREPCGDKPLHNVQISNSVGAGNVRNKSNFFLDQI